MSVKIYNGLIAIDSDPFVVGKRIRETLEPLFLSKFAHIHKGLSGYPSGSVFNDSSFFDEDDTPIVDYRLDVDLHRSIVALHKRSTWVFDDADIFYDAVIIPNKAGGNPLVMLFTGVNEQEYMGALKNAGVVREFAYWNNSDREDGETAESWKQREEAWGYLIEDNYAPAEIGLRVSAPSSLTSTMYLYDERTK